MNVNIPKDEYKKRADDSVPKSNIWTNMLKAFVVGGLICTLGQAINEAAAYCGKDEKTAATITSMTLIFLAILATAFSLYDNLGRFAGAGSLLPITGFANSIASPAMEYRSEGYITGIGVRMFVIAGPVLVYGISASIIGGLIYYFIK